MDNQYYPCTGSFVVDALQKNTLDQHITHFKLFLHIFQAPLKYPEEDHHDKPRCIPYEDHRCAGEKDEAAKKEYESMLKRIDATKKEIKELQNSFPEKSAAVGKSLQRKRE